MRKQLDSRLYLTAQEAASTLGISIASLYSYVSRGLIKSQSADGSRSKGYLRSDIAALKNKQRGAKDDPNFFFSPDLKKDRITQITKSGPIYRGKLAASLARTETLESVAALLWQSDTLPFETSRLPVIPSDLSSLRSRIKGLNPMNQYISLFAAIEQANPKAYNLSEEGVICTGVDVTRWLVAIIADSDDYPATTPIHEYLASKRGANEGCAELLRALLVLAADHQQGPASLAAKNTAYAGNTPYAAVASALITWQGAFVLQGMVQPLTHFLLEIMTSSDPTSTIISRLQGGAPLPGFDHPIYGAKDPRGALLLELTKEYLPDDNDARKLCQAAEAAEELTGRSPSLNLFTNFLAYKFSMSDQMRALTAVSRCVGWLAHAFEIYKSNNPFGRQNESSRGTTVSSLD